MKTTLLNLIALMLLGSQMVAQSTCLNNPSIQAGDIDPAPLSPGSSGVFKLTYSHGGQEYADFASDPMEIVICFANIAPATGVSSLGGTFDDRFDWSINGSGCLVGMQNQTFVNNDGGIITVDFVQTNPIACPANQMGFTANIHPPQCMNATDLKGDNSERSFTCVTDDDTLPDEGENVPVISISDARVIEGQDATVSICLDQIVSNDITADLEIGTGSAGVNDYNHQDISISIPAGTQCISVVIPTYTDDEIERSETFTLTLINADNATINTDFGVGIVTIEDPNSIPTLGEWGLILLIISLLILGTLYLSQTNRNSKYSSQI